jgi:hypothetical protein
MQLKGNKLTAVLGTAEICQLFYSVTKNVTIKIVFDLVLNENSRNGRHICNFCI